MSKRVYYVDIGPSAGEIRTTSDVNDPIYEYEILATDEELSKLQQLFERIQEIDFRTFFSAHNPLETGEIENIKEDQKMIEIYQIIYQLGTKETKKKMREANLPI